MQNNEIRGGEGGLDALLNDALDAFDAIGEDATRFNQPSSSKEAPAASKKTNGNLAFDPLKSRRLKSKPSTTVEAEGSPSNNSNNTIEVRNHEQPTNDTFDSDINFDALQKLLSELALQSSMPQDGADGSQQSGAVHPSTELMNEDEDVGLAATLRALAQQHASLGQTTAPDNDDQDDFLEKLAAQLQQSLQPPLAEDRSPTDNSSNNSNFPPGMASFVDSIMHQLVSKDVLYQPMKDIGDKYPEWLAAHETVYSDQGNQDQFKKYKEQYEYIQQLCHVYETEPENYTKIMDLLQQMQERGSPPAAIMDALAVNTGGDPLQMMMAMNGGESGSATPLVGPNSLPSPDCCIQ